MAELVYLYGLIPTEQAEAEALPASKGLDGQHNIQTLLLGGLTAIVCHLDPQVYSEEVIKEKLSNDMEWLQHKAFHHHEMLLSLQERYTIVPMKFCTIYSDEESLKKTINEHAEAIKQTLILLKGNEEWNLKIYCDDEELKKHVLLHNSKIDEHQQKISQLPPGRQFFERKKIEKLVHQELENEKNRICESLHEKLNQFSIKDTVKKNWSKEVTGREDSMSWNSVYLLPADKVESFLEEVHASNETMAESGWRLEASGPWPPYHFANLN